MARYLTLQRLREHLGEPSRVAKKECCGLETHTFWRLRATAQQPAVSQGTNPSMQAIRAVRPAGHSQAPRAAKQYLLNNNFCQCLTG